MIAMKTLAPFLLMLAALPISAQTMDHSSPRAADAGQNEQLGTVSFSVSCAASSQAAFSRGVALLHDFWYEEARSQFDQIIKSDPRCAMAHWGVAMSAFHQIWGRPGADTKQLGREQMQAWRNRSTRARDRERGYIAALASFYRPGSEEFPARINAYSAAMGRLYARYPDDVDAGAFYALSLLSAETPDDTSLSQQHKAMAVLTPLFAKVP